MNELEKAQERIPKYRKNAPMSKYLKKPNFDEVIAFPTREQFQRFLDERLYNHCEPIRSNRYNEDKRLARIAWAIWIQNGYGRLRKTMELTNYSNVSVSTVVCSLRRMGIIKYRGNKNNQLYVLNWEPSDENVFTDRAKIDKKVVAKRKKNLRRKNS